MATDVDKKRDVAKKSFAGLMEMAQPPMYKHDLYFDPPPGLSPPWDPRSPPKDRNKVETQA